MPSSDAWWKAHIVQPQIQSVSRTVWQQDPMDACTKGHTSKFRTGRTIQAETQKEMISKWRNASSKGGCKCGCRRTVHCILLKEHVWKQANIYMYILCIYVYIYIYVYIGTSETLTSIHHSPQASESVLLQCYVFHVQAWRRVRTDGTMRKQL